MSPAATAPRWLVVADEPAVARAAEAILGDRVRIATIGEASERIPQAWETGVRRVAVWGGDRAIHVVTRALLERCATTDVPLEAPRAEDPFVANAGPIVASLVPLGENGLARTLGTATDPARLGTHLSGAIFGPLDVCWLASGEERVPLVVAARGSVGASSIRITGDERTLRGDRPSAPIELSRGAIVVANAQFVGGDRLAPRAVPHDGAVDLVAGPVFGWMGRGARRRLLRGDRPGGAIAERLMSSGAIEGALSLRVDEAIEVVAPLTFTVETTRLGLGV